MMNLINELLDFSKIQSGSFTVESEPVRVAGLLKRAVRSLQTVASRDEVFLLSAHGRDIPQIIGSMEKLTQAVINLISNSLKFTPKKGLISVGAQIVRNGELPESIVITVTDSGMGIKAAELQKIWEKYKQSANKSIRGDVADDGAVADGAGQPHHAGGAGVLLVVLRGGEDLLRVERRQRRRIPRADRPVDARANGRLEETAAHRDLVRPDHPPPHRL